MLDCKTSPPIYSSTSASWLNLVERWFGEITRKRIRRDVFTSVPKLLAAIDEFIRLTDKNPRRSCGPKQPKTFWRRSSMVKPLVRHNTSGREDTIR